MAYYEIQWKNSAEQDLKKLDRHQIPRIVKTIESLANNPFSLQHVKLRDTERFYRIRVGDYRIIYEVDTDVKIIVIYYIRHRKEAYRRL